MNDRVDENVVRTCQQGDKTAYAVLVKKHYRHVFALCLGMLANVHDAEDVAQETMLKGLLNIRKLAKPERFESWIMRIAKNLCIDCLRRQKRAKSVPPEHPARPAQHTSENHDLERAVRRLPQELRLPLTMYYFEQKNAKSIAEKLNISHSLACRRIRTARTELHELLTERVHDE